MPPARLRGWGHCASGGPAVWEASGIDWPLTLGPVFNPAWTSSRYCQEGDTSWGELEPASLVPTPVAVFPHDLMVPIRRLAERNHNIVRWTDMALGGHFASLEVPEVLAAELRAAFL